MELLPRLIELKEVMKVAGLLAGIPFALMVPWIRPRTASSWRRRIALMVSAVCFLLWGAIAGGCLLGGVLQGAGFCAIPGPGAKWHPVSDFYLIQALWAIGALFCCVSAAALALGLLPGKATGWQRFEFLISRGRQGAWRDEPPPPPLLRDPIAEKALAELAARIERETDPARKAELIGAAATVRKLREKEAQLEQELHESSEADRAVRWASRVGVVAFALLSLGYLVPIVMGVLTGKTFPFGLRGGSVVDLLAQPYAFWATMGTSLLMSLLMALAACVAYSFRHFGLQRSRAERLAEINFEREVAQYRDAPPPPEWKWGS